MSYLFDTNKWTCYTSSPEGQGRDMRCILGTMMEGGKH